MIPPRLTNHNPFSPVSLSSYSSKTKLYSLQLIHCILMRLDNLSFLLYQETGSICTANGIRHV